MENNSPTPQLFTHDRTLVMGIVNATPDSFSDGGEHLTAASAVARARTLIAQGADLIDVGGESTRPGATRVSAEEEAARVVPVVRELAAAGIPLSVDTMRASTASAAIAAGATLINDVSGGLADPQLLPTVAAAGVPICLMHWDSPDFEGAQGAHPTGNDFFFAVQHHLLQRAAAAERAGISAENIILDPGIGFAKTPRQNWQLLQCMPEMRRWDYPVLIGASRKRFLTALRPGPDGQPGTPRSADDATAAVSALAAHAGLWAVRVHEAAASRAAVDVAYCARQGNGPDVAANWRARRD